MNAVEAEKDMDQKRREFNALCESFGFTPEQTDEEWRKWLLEQE